MKVYISDYPDNLPHYCIKRLEDINPPHVFENDFVGEVPEELVKAYWEAQDKFVELSMQLERIMQKDQEENE